MISLFKSEWERMWAKRITWLFLLSLPAIVMASAKYYMKNNQVVPINSPEYTYANSFPIMGLSEQLMGTFNVILLVTIVMMFANEYHTGQMRMLLQRSYSYRQVIFVKVLNVFIFSFLILLVYFICSYVIGYVFFDHKSSIKLFFHSKVALNKDVFIYNIKYYILAYVSLLAVGSTFIMLCIISRSTTGAILMGMVFLFLSMAYPTILQLLIPATFAKYITFTSLIIIQFQGIPLMLSEQHLLVFWNLSVIIIYIIFCNGITFLLAKKDNFI
ncbi:ABC transporter permease [Bacillus cereus]|nr:ABC transporter permease [Bacillus cereus]MDA1766870.1 ABC transporter permease [Bacillus cereus]